MEAILNHLQNAAFEVLEIIVAGALIFFIERIKPADRLTSFIKEDSKTELLLALFNILLFIPLIVFFVAKLIELTLAPFVTERLFSDELEALPVIAQVILGAIILDFATYWRHRFTHYYMWPYHAVHHSATQVNWLTSLRLHPVDLFAAILFNGVVLFFLGFGGVGFFGALLLVRVMNYFTHININIKFPKPIRYLIASPHYHRWHHAAQREAYNTNFCGTFSFWDVLFGTYYHPEELPKAYGISPVEQKNFPATSYLGWLLYPFKRNIHFLRNRLGSGESPK